MSSSPAGDPDRRPVTGEAPSSRAPSIVVLPLEDRSQFKDHAHLAEGIAEEIGAALSRSPTLRVLASAVAAQLKDAASDPTQLGARLGVDWVLKGALRRVGDQLLITVQLFSTSDGAQHYSHRFEGPFSGVFKLQEDIGLGVLEALPGARGRREAASAHATPASTSAGAYEYFLRGRQLLRHQDEAFLSQAEEALSHALQLDPSFALAWASLAQVHAIRMEWYGGGATAADAAERASNSALAFGAELAEAHLARGVVLAMRRDYVAAEPVFQEALRRNPRSFDAYYQLARTQMALTQFDLAAESFRKASELQPEDFQALILSSMALTRLGKTAEAQAAQREGIRRAERLLKWNPENTRALSLGACALVDAGDRERALEWCSRAVKLAPNDVGVNYNAGCLFAKLGRAEDALGCLERTFGRGFGKRDWVEHDPDWNLLRGHPRFAELLARLP